MHRKTVRHPVLLPRPGRMHTGRLAARGDVYDASSFPEGKAVGAKGGKMIRRDSMSKDTRTGKQRGGRPTKLTPSMLARLYVYACEIALVAACRLLEVDRVTVWRWTKRREDVRAVVRRAREIARENQRRERERHPEGFRNIEKPKRRLTKKIVQPPRKYRPEMARYVLHSLRATARVLGVHWITVHRWTRKHRDFGDAQALARAEMHYERLLAMPGIRKLLRGL